jgi:ATP-binding cassette subfamily F protein uup
LTGQGEFLKIMGSWANYQNLKTRNMAREKEKIGKKKSVETSKSQSLSKSEYSFVDQHRLKQLPILIERISYEIKKLEEFLTEPTLYLEHPLKFEKASTALIERQSDLKNLEDEWLILEEKALSIGNE